MERLTSHWGDNYVPVQFDISEIASLSKETFSAFQEIVKRLAEYEDTGLTPEEINQISPTSLLKVGDTVYVVTRYSPTRPYEVISCKIKKKTVKNRNNFSVTGWYQNGNYYHGNFTDTSLGKTVFHKEGEAIFRRDSLNT